MKQSSKPKNNKRKPHYDNTLEEQTMLFWRLQQQWNHQELPGYKFQVGEGLRLLDAIASNEELPYALRDSAEALNRSIIMNEKPKPLEPRVFGQLIQFNSIQINH